MSKPQDYEYMRRFDDAEKDEFSPTLSDLALDGWEPIFSTFSHGLFSSYTYTLLRRLRPDVKTEAAG